MQSSCLILSTLILTMPMAAFGDEPPKPITTGDIKISLANLNLLVKPLTKDELKVEANGWLALLRNTVKDACDREIELGKAEGEARDTLIEAVSQLNDQRVAVTDRLNTVLAAYKAKGGAREEYDTYIAAVSGITVDVTDATRTGAMLVNWLKSPEGGIRYGRNILLFVLTLVVFRVIAGIIANVLGRAMGSVKTVSHLLRDFVVNATRKVIMFVGFVVALSMLEVNIGPFLAAMGAIGFVIGFALQGTLGNFAAGIMILLYRPYDLRDKVTVAGVTGEVLSMSLVSTVLRNNDQHIVTIPNSSIWGGTITNLGAVAASAKA